MRCVPRCSSAGCSPRLRADAPARSCIRLALSGVNASRQPHGRCPRLAAPALLQRGLFAPCCSSGVATYFVAFEERGGLLLPHLPLPRAEEGALSFGSDASPQPENERGAYGPSGRRATATAAWGRSGAASSCMVASAASARLLHVSRMGAICGWQRSHCSSAVRFAPRCSSAGCGGVASAVLV